MFRGGLVLVVVFDWLEMSEMSDSLYDYVIIGVDGASGIYVWMFFDVDVVYLFSVC